MGALLAAAPPKDKSKDLPHAIAQERLPIRIYGGFLVVAEGQFGGGGQRQNFILDTGTSPSILNLRVAKQLGLKLSPAKVTTVGQDSDIAVATVPEVDLGPLQANSAPFLVADLAGVEQTWRLRIAGILGLDILGKLSFRLDYEHRVLTFGEVTGEGIPIGLSTRLNLPIAEVKLNGRSVRLLVDTGSDHLVVFGKQVGGVRFLNTIGESLTGTSITGTAPVRAAPSLEFEWNGERFKQNAVIVPDREEPLFDGLLSVHSMRFRTLAMDANTHIVYLQK